MNFIHASVISDDTISSKAGKLKFNLTVEQKNHIKDYLNKEIIIGIRPEDIRLENVSKNSIELEILIEVTEPMGNETFIYFEVEKNQFIARVQPVKDLKASEKIKLYIDPTSVYFFDKKSGKNILRSG
jgi:multiple sugar transport system ATP-binding protein